ncbi:MAG: hypothetical protein WCI53_13865 [Bacteroidota bacterium]
MRIENNNYIPVTIKPQIKSFFQAINEIKKIKSSFQEQKRDLDESKKRLKETVEIFKLESQNIVMNRCNTKKIKLETNYQEKQKLLKEIIVESFKVDTIQNENSEKIENAVLGLQKLIEIDKKTKKGIDSYTEKLIEKINEIKSYNVKSLPDSGKVNLSEQIINDEIKNNKQQYELCVEADLYLGVGDYKNALKVYNSILSDRYESKNLKISYVPLEEQLRQASKLYIFLQTIIDRLNLDENIRIDLFSSAIAAHTQGKFSLSKIEVLDMLNKQFYYA